MDPLRRSELLDYIDRARNVFLRDNADERLLPFLIMVLSLFAFFLIMVYFVIKRMRRFRGETCRQCGTTMKRVHQVWWLRPFGRLVPLRTMFCRECRKKTFRHFPTKGERRKRRRSPV